MIKFKLKHSFKKKSMLLPFLIVSSLFICVKALASWDKYYCKVYDNRFSDADLNLNRIQFDFKFFEYEKLFAVNNAFLKQLDIEYSTNRAKIYTHLMSASTENQTTRTWSWIKLNNKQAGSKIKLFLCPYLSKKFTYIDWKEDTNLKLNVENETLNETWITVNWHPNEDQFNTTIVRLTAIWSYHGNPTGDEKVVIERYVKFKKTKSNLNSLNFSNSSPKEEIRTDDKDNTVKAYKEANTIVVEGALNENIQVYTTTGALIKSMVSDCDVLQIPVSSNQLYIVNVGQVRYKLAL